MPTLLETVIFFSVAGAISFYLLKFGLSHIYDVRLSEGGIDVILLGRFCITTFDFESLEAAYEDTLFLTSMEWTACTIRLGNRMSTKFIVIKRRSGRFKYITVTPAQPRVFLAQIKDHIAKRDETRLT